MNDPGGLHTPPPPALRPTLQHEGFYALLANGEIADPAEVEAMVASLQSLMPLTSPEEARLHLSQNRWSLQETIRQHVQADSLPRTLGAEFERAKTKLVTDTQTSPTTAQQVSGGLGAQSTKVLDRVYEPGNFGERNNYH